MNSAAVDVAPGTRLLAVSLTCQRYVCVSGVAGSLKVPFSVTASPKFTTWSGPASATGFRSSTRRVFPDWIRARAKTLLFA